MDIKYNKNDNLKIYITKNELKAAFASESEFNKLIKQIEKEAFPYLIDLKAAIEAKERADFLNEILNI